MTRTSPTRVEDDLFQWAQVVGAVMDRSAAQQITHWARIGREVEASASVSYKRIAGALTHHVRYDDLGPEEQAVVRAEWKQRMDALRHNLNLAQPKRRRNRRRS